MVRSRLGVVEETYHFSNAKIQNILNMQIFFQIFSPAGPPRGPLRTLRGAAGREPRQQAGTRRRSGPDGAPQREHRPERGAHRGFFFECTGLNWVGNVDYFSIERECTPPAGQRRRSEGEGGNGGRGQGNPKTTPMQAPLGAATKERRGGGPQGEGTGAHKSDIDGCKSPY